MKKLALAVILLAAIVLPSCKSRKHDFVTTTTTEYKQTSPSGYTNSKEVVTVEQDGYDEADGYDNERLA